MNVLIIGGNRFFGKKLAQKWVAQRASVTLLNRGHHEDGLGLTVERLKCDRSDKDQLQKAIGGRTWDIIYDQVCYELDEAQTAADLFANKTPHYIFTSSQSVYGPGESLAEELFDPKYYRLGQKASRTTEYAEAKRQCETVFAKSIEPILTIVRPPIVLGTDDYTNRLRFHIEHIRSRKPIYFPNIEANMSFINSDDAAAALFFLGQKKVKGIFNIASAEPIQLKAIVKEIEKQTQHTALLAKDGTSDNQSPFGVEQDWWMKTDRLKKAGFEAAPISKWLQKVIQGS